MFKATLCAVLIDIFAIASASPVARAVNTGDLTFFAPGLGACGVFNTANDPIVAVSPAIFDQFGSGNPNNNPVCGRQIKINANGKSVIAQVEDKCPSCAAGDLDLSPAVFNQFADPSVGRIHGASWDFV